MNTLEKLSEELRNIALDRKEGFDKKSNELIGYLSMRVFGAINPVDCVTASFTILVLQNTRKRFLGHTEGRRIWLEP